jgi:hypothetical protein
MASAPEEDSRNEQMTIETDTAALQAGQPGKLPAFLNRRFCLRLLAHEPKARSAFAAYCSNFAEAPRCDTLTFSLRVDFATRRARPSVTRANARYG